MGATWLMNSLGASPLLLSLIATAASRRNVALLLLFTYR